MKTNTFKKVTAIVLSATMMIASSVTAFASEDPTTAPGSGNILAYNNETYIVPTSLKVALNPNELGVNTKYKKTEDTSVDEDKIYYIYDSEGNKYEYVAEPDDSDIEDYYEATVSKAQIVSFNYGIVNESTKDKKVNITLAVTGNGANSGDDFSDITFVDSAADATAKTSAAAETGAGFNELKMFLTIDPSTAAPTADTYAETQGDFDSGKTYYTWDNTNKKYVEAEGLAEFAEGVEYYEATTTIGTRILASELADVNMTAVAAEKKIPFKAETTAGTVSASVAYKLSRAEYAPIKGEIIDWSTTQDQLKDKVELSTIGGTAAFTISGVMNKNADWTKAKSTVLTITPTYSVVDAKGTEVAIENAGYNQIKTDDDIAAEEAAAAEEELATALAAFKLAHEDVVTLLGDLTAVTGEDAEQTKIQAAITAFENLDATDDAALIAALAANDPAITADTLEALKDASEAAATPAAPTELSGIYDTEASPKVYSITLAAAVSDVSDITNIKVNGIALSDGISTNASRTKVKLVKDDVKAAIGDTDWATTTELVFTFTVNSVNYICTIVR